MLKKAIGESSGGGSDVQASFALRRDLKVLERGFQLETAATHVPFGTLDLDPGVPQNLQSRLFRSMSIHRHSPGHDRPLSLLPRCAKTSGGQELVDTGFAKHVPIVEKPVHLENPV
jgi:hypothetical protein